MESENAAGTKSTIASMEQHLKAVWDKIEEKGGTIPANKNMANVPAAIASIGG